MNAFIDGFLFLRSHLGAVLSLLAAFGLGAFLVFALLRQTLAARLNLAESLVLALGGALIPWEITLLLFFLLRQLFDIGPLVAVLALILGGLSVIHWMKKSYRPQPGVGMFLALAAVFVVSLYVRLAFVSDLIVPLYFDSVLHVRLIDGFLADFSQFPWQVAGSPVSGYYHIGFHYFAAALSAVTGLSASDVILVLGQILITAIPFPVFFIVRRETGADWAGFLALLLAGWGWSMPVHALDWGKYPLLGSLLTLQLPLALAYLLDRDPPVGRWRWIWGLVCALGVFIATLTHSRTLIFIAILSVSYIVSRKWDKWSNHWLRWGLFGLVLVGLVSAGYILEHNSVLRLVFDPYLRDGFWITLLVIVLFPVALKEFRSMAFTALVASLLLLASLLSPPFYLLPSQPYQTLLDRPFVQTALFFPLAVLGGLGCAGLVRILQKASFIPENFKPAVKWMLIAVLFLGVVLSVPWSVRVKPSGCCMLFGRDDAVAVDWMEKHLPAKSTILISSVSTDVFDGPNPLGYRGADGGIWITPLTTRPTVLEVATTDFTTQESFDRLCQQNITHIYVGGIGQHFNLEQLQAHPQWYQPVLSLPGAQVFVLRGCVK